MSAKCRTNLNDFSNALRRRGLAATKNGMAKRDQPHWGEWVEERARIVGLRDKRAILRVVDVTSRQLDRWLKSAEPPRMHGSNARALAAALRVSELALEIDWQFRFPEDVPFEGEPPAAVVPDSTSGQRESGAAALRREIRGIADALSGEYLEALAAAARQQMQQWLAQQEAPPRKAASERHRVRGAPRRGRQ